MTKNVFGDKWYQKSILSVFLLGFMLKGIKRFLEFKNT